MFHSWIFRKRIWRSWWSFSVNWTILSRPRRFLFSFIISHTGSYFSTLRAALYYIFVRLVRARTWEILFNFSFSTHSQRKLWWRFEGFGRLILSRTRDIFVINKRLSFWFIEANMHTLETVLRLILKINKIFCYLVRSWVWFWLINFVLPRHWKTRIRVVHRIKIRIIISRAWSRLQILDYCFYSQTVAFTWSCRLLEYIFSFVLSGLIN